MGKKIRLHFVQLIYSYFSHSSTCFERLKSVFNVLDKKLVGLQKLFDIHWLSRLQAVKTIVKSYEALILYFDDQANEAKGIFVYSFYKPWDNLTLLFNFLHRKITEVSKALKSRYLEERDKIGSNCK